MSYEKFGPYILLEKLATGGMAEVYLAKSIGTHGVNKFVAIKRILPQFSTNQEFIDMFQEEAKVSVNLNHSNVVNIHDFGFENQQFYIVMEFVEGKNLRQLTNELKKSNRTLKIEEAVYIIKEAAAGLDHAHRCLDKHSGRPLNITHRDMSPQNIMLSYEGEAKVIDFGIAKQSEGDKEETRAGTLKGKFAYMSPEQAEAEEVDPRTDIFALGIILWELLTNARLFDGSNEQITLRKVRECNVKSLKKINHLIPEELDKIVLKTLAKDKNLRYQTAAALQKDLNRFLNTQFPDFSPQDFSKTMIDAFKESYKLGREKQIQYAKVELSQIEPEITEQKFQNSEVQSKKSPSQGKVQTPPPPPTTQSDKPAETQIIINELKGIHKEDYVKIELNGLKEAAVNFGKNAATSKNNLGHSPISGRNSFETPNSKTQTTQLTRSQRGSQNAKVSNESFDVFLKLVVIISLSVGGYIYYNKNTSFDPSIANHSKSNKNNSPGDGQIDLAGQAQVKLSILSTPNEAAIFIDNMDTKKITPSIISVTANKNVIITLKKDQYYNYEVQRAYTETSTLNATMQALPQAAYVNINVQNGGANPVVYIDEQRLNESLPIRRYAVPADKVIKVSASNPITQLKDEVTINLTANSEKTVNLILGRKPTSTENINK